MYKNDFKNKVGRFDQANSGDKLTKTLLTSNSVKGL